MDYFRSDLATRKPVEINVPRARRMMSLNESDLNPFEIIPDDLINIFSEVPLNRYFNDVTQELEKSLAEYVEVPADHLIYGNGADEMLYFTFTAVRENDNAFAVSLAPSYFDYKSYSAAVGLNIKFIPLDSSYDFDPGQLLEAGKSNNCKLYILCNPNNPTGNLLAEEKILEIVKESGKLVLIDETYFEFSGKTFKDLIPKYDNLVIIRSFSKGFSAAGLRFGYLISNPGNICELKKVIPVFHMNLLTKAIVTKFLKRRDLFLSHNQRVIKYREDLCSELRKLPGLVVKNTSTNFLLFSIGSQTDALFGFLKTQDISVRPVGAHPLLKDFLRVTLSSEDDNKYFLEAVKKFIYQR